MCWSCGLLFAVVLGIPYFAAAAQSPTAVSGASEAAPLPDTPTLLRAMEQNQKKMESLRKDYTYHVHTESQKLDKNGAVRGTETEDAESLTIDGVRVDKVVARNGKPLTPEEQKKESDRIDKVVAKARERRAKAESKGTPVNENGQDEITLSRILELGTFSNPRRGELSGRPVIVLDYNGDPKAKTKSAFETVFRDLTGTIWVDEADQVLVRGQGRLVRDFKLGGGLVMDVRKDTSFDFQSHRVNDGIWLPGTIDATGAARVLLLANFRGHLHLTTSDYRRFRASATIVGSHGAIGPDGEPLPGPQPASPETTAPTPAPPSHSQHDK